MTARRHLLTVVLEDYYHLSPFKGLISRDHWRRFERRVEIGTRRALDLLDEYHLRATFFVLGWVAEVAPELVREVAERGHEVASKGYYHRGIREMTPETFREDLTRAHAAIERATGQQVRGYRVAERWFEPADLWALDALAELGYAYDSSVKPVFRAFAREPWRRRAHRHTGRHGSIWEFPVSSASVLGMQVPIGGGNYFRQLPHPLVRRAVARWDRVEPTPFMMYFHTWELDPEQPRIQAASALARVRQYRNLERMEGIIRYYLERYRFQSISDHLGLAPAALAPPAAESLPLAVWIPRQAGTPSEAVTVVIPCYNEENSLPYLAGALESLEETLAPLHSLRFLFVDDGSTDATWGLLQQTFGSRADCELLRHPGNRGLAAAIQTGIRASGTDIVCSIDCDCTYDPGELRHMIPLLVDGVDLVTASPYHPRGGVRNVPRWRLWLSRGASRLYRLVLRQKLSTYTSCFRVYRRNVVLDLNLREPGFLGVTELLGEMALQGRGVVEHPALLEVRLLGRSKMKIAATVLGHLRLMARLAGRRVAGRWGGRSRRVSARAEHPEGGARA
jgi:polysaccharide deacetylase family protein (PEP-CTERM system associated)